MAKQPTAAQKRHHTRIRGMGCLVCKRPASVHHVVSTGYKRVSKDHRYVAPLCPEHHQDGPHAVHKIGHAAFAEMFGTDLLLWAISQWGISELRKAV